jgi:hypothetical protein
VEGIPTISRKFLKNHSILPLSVPLGKIDGKSWAIVVSSVANVPVITVRKRETEEDEQAVLDIIDYRENRLMISVYENLTMHADDGHFHGRLVESATYQNGEKRYFLQDLPKPNEQHQARVKKLAVHIDPKGQRLHVLRPEGKEALATLERRSGNLPPRNGEFMELHTSQELDPVLVLAIGMAFVVFVPPLTQPRMLPAAGPLRAF